VTRRRGGTYDDGVTAKAAVSSKAAGGGNAFGVPTSLDDWLELIGLAVGASATGDAEAGETAGQVVRRIQMAEATGRWRISSVNGYRQPRRYVPGDVVALQALVALGVMAEADEGHTSIRTEQVGVARLALASQAYWLPAGVEAALLSSEPPGKDDLATLRLPHQASAVWFAQPARVSEGPGLAPSLDSVLAEALQRGVQTHFETLWEGVELVNRVARDPEAEIEGVVLLADEDGRPRDEVAWVVRVAPEPPARWQRGIVLGRRSAAGWHGVLELLSAIVGWGDWRPPPAIRDWAEEPSRSQLRQLRFGATKRAEEQGALAGVRVLDAHRRRPAAVGEGVPHASPVTHLRRGHWRRQPVGPRDAGGRELRFIAPIVVNPGGRTDEVVRVYRLPRPE
jgi:hypothetical protein